ncbi:ABC transporter substrate-binding protein [Chryseoglobus sp. 28M-23]|uniref:ABC transporter substrate-binding protein n=1 Tax=Chryseoglobus sp. 28M-23 TaxID=2772253 RepID=UPI0017467FE2|nr:ABC transporter substrate-binding protein [Chryseoglobus sp. 28M-23]QOD94027.1 ABC transporter substrate-binding protein [Chryseoglobus sp. 28M-23]
MSVVAGCTPAPADNAEEGEIVWAIGGPRSQPGGAHLSIAELWNEENPDTPVRVEALPEAADGAREQQALVLQAGGSEFDVLGLDVIWTGEYVENDWIVSLEDVRADLEGVTLPGPMESSSWGGELWAAPLNTNAGILYYRTDLVDEAPRTWTELCAAAESIAAEEGMDGFIGQGARYEGFVVNWLELFWSAGGDLYNSDQSEVVFDVDLATEVTEFIAESVDDGCFAPGYNTAMEEESRIAFQSGDAAFMRNWPGPYALIADDSESPANGVTGVAPLPSFTGEPGVSAIGGFNNAVSAFSERQDIAKDFVVWAATSVEVQTILAEDAVLPVHVPLYDEFADDPVMQQLGEILQDAKPRPAAPQWAEISLEMQRTLFEAANGQMSARDAAEQMRTFLEGTLNG